MKKVLLTVSVTALLMLAAAYPAPADLSLDVAPAKYEVQVSPGTLQTFPITVRNTGDTSLHVQASLSDFAVAPGGDYVFSKPGQNRYSLAKWASINPREFDVAPNSFQLIRFTLSVPHGVAGEYSGIVFFQTRPQRHAGPGLAFSERIASKIYAYTPNSLHVDGSIDNVTEKPLGVGERFSVGFKNTGNAHLYLNGRIDIHRGSEFVATVALPQQMLVERGGRRLIQTLGPKLSPGSYSATALIDYGGPSLAGGQMNFTVH
jgi:hypothetical protein